MALGVNGRNGLAREDGVVRQRGLFSDSENDEERSNDLSATVIRQPCSKTAVSGGCKKRTNLSLGEDWQEDICNVAPNAAWDDEEQGVNGIKG